MQALNATRTCAVAGSFYSKNSSELSHKVKELLKNAKTVAKEDVNAIIVPHAGYVFSAQTASIAYKTLHKKYRNIFLIGSSHHASFDSASIYTQGNYKTPLGEISTNMEIVAALMKNRLFTYEKDAHTKEHTLEVQLPFLQTLYKNDLSIVPIIIGTNNLQTIEELSKILKPYFDDKENLFVISTDLSHYPTNEDAQSVDKRTLNAISKNSTQKLLDTLVENENSSTSGLVTSACGWSSLLTLLHMTQNETYTYELLEYTNSSDSKYGDEKRVGGYGAMRVYKDESDFFLTYKEKEDLLNIAKLSLYEATINQTRVQIDEKGITPKLKRHLGAFVTLYENGNLRGCIGQFEPDKPLYNVTRDMAIASAQNDTRFSKVTKDELKNIDIEISVLTPRKRIYSLDELILGKHGIYVKLGNKNGTYLPHVATQMKWNKEEFIRHCAVEKAKIDPSKLDEIELYIYEAMIID